MHRSSTFIPFATTLFTTLALAGCGAPADPQSEASLVIRGSAGTPRTDGPARSPQGVPPGALVGDPASLKLSLYKLYIGTQTDCSDLALVDDHSTTPLDVDLVDDPILFSGSPLDGTYGCVAFVMSDLVRVQPTQSFGACDAGTEYVADIYRAGQADFRDVDGLYTTGTGTDEVPSSDIVTVILSRDPTAAAAQGYSTHQILPLGSPLIVPGTSTFYWNGNDSVISANGSCGVNPGQPEFL
ncbi:MAG: hypothetical protein ABI193_21290 [Minicystis sp.]